MTGSTKQEYQYRPTWTLIVSVAAFFGLAAVVLSSAAMENDRGLIINGIIHLDPEGATVFYWALTACSAGFVVIAAFLARHRFVFRQRLAFGSTGLIVPASRWSQEEKEIAYRDISALSEAKISGQRFLYITHSEGKYTINASMLPSKDAYAEFCELLSLNVNAARAGRVALDFKR
jgi:hypothetical protein